MLSNDPLGEVELELILSMKYEAVLREHPSHFTSILSAGVRETINLKRKYR